MNGNSVLNTSITNRIPWAAASGCIAIAGTLALVGLLALASPAFAATATVGLGTTSSYSVLAGETVTNTGPSTLAGNVGVEPRICDHRIPPGNFDGADMLRTPQQDKAKSDLRIAYDDAAGRAPDGSVAGDLVGQTKTAGVYKSTGPLALSGTLTLDAQGDPNAVFVFQVASDADHRVGQQRQHDQRRYGMQCVLAGRQFRDVGHEFGVPRNDHGVDVDQRDNRHRRPRPRPGPQRTGVPGQQRLHQ